MTSVSRWPAILGIVLGGLLTLSLCGGVFARKRTGRLYGVRPLNPALSQGLTSVHSAGLAP